MTVTLISRMMMSLREVEVEIEGEGECENELEDYTMSFGMVQDEWESSELQIKWPLHLHTGNNRLWVVGGFYFRSEV